MSIHASCGSIKGMDISLLSTTNDIEQLRTMAFAMVQEMVSENAEKEKRIHLLEEALILARQQRFGRKSEVLSGLQRQLFEEDVDTDIAETEVRLRKLLQPDDADKAKPASGAVRKPLPSSLPRVVKTITPASTEDCPDPDCPGKLRYIRDEVSEKLEYIPAHFVVNQYVRPQYSCTCCQQVVSGEMPAQIIPKGSAEASLVAQVVVSKYRDYLPLYRQQHIFARADVDLSVSTMAGWVGAASVALTPLAEQLRRLILAREVIHADETTMRILDTRKGGVSRQGYLWTYVSGEHTGEPVVIFECHGGRGARYPLAFLSEWVGGYLVTDDYDAYKLVAKENPGIINVRCWSHARRRFAELYKANKDPRAEFVLKVLARMFHLEERIRSRSPENKVRWRRRYIKPLLDKLYTWLTEQRDACAPGSALYKALNYPLKEKTWPSLVRFLEDGRVPMENNRAERAIRPVAMGRSSWLFAGSLAAGERAAQIMGLLETAKMNGLEPHAWLTDVLKRLPSWPEGRLHELLPFPAYRFSE
ncbi:IS66 family transposase [Salmonella enterica]|nr:IS66 family transposase [Salmonella enterica]ECT6519212.1 IS66 family transposase [Salmonella enterica]EDX8941800.1 IS66 family transposase [Salmonella enterica subsp. enterica serovar Aba]